MAALTPLRLSERWICAPPFPGSLSLSPKTSPPPWMRICPPVTMLPVVTSPVSVQPPVKAAVPLLSV